MTLPRIALASSLVLATVLACLAPRERVPEETITARELLVLEQHQSGANYTYDRATSEALAAARVARPGEGADAESLLASLRAAGFGLRELPVPDKKVFVVERSGS